MSAGPYPTKTMHEQLKNRVNTLETGPGGGGGGGGGDVGSVDGQLAVYPVFPRDNTGFLGVQVYDGEALPVLEMPLKLITYTLPPRQYSISQLRLVVPLGLDLMAHPPGITVASANTEYGVTLQVADMQIEAGNDSQQVTLTLRIPTVIFGGFVTVEFQDDFTGGSAVLPVFDLSGSSKKPSGLAVKSYGQVKYGTPETNEGFGFGIDLNFSDSPAVVGGVLHPRQFPVMLLPTPQNVGQDPNAGQGSETGVEVVWPAGGTPYLHVYLRDTYGHAGEHFHLPLTPGLPQ